MWNSRVVKEIRRVISSVLCVALIVCGIKIPVYASEFPGGSNSNGENEFVAGTFEFPSSIYSNYELKNEYYYSDDYFKNSATIFDDHMATMSLNFALTAFSNYFYDIKERSADARALFGKLGFNNVTPNSDYLAEPEPNTMGVICANKHIYVKEGSDVREYNLIAVGMRSSNYKNEWYSNFKMGPSGDHQGFVEASTIAYNHVKSFYETHKSDFKASATDPDLPPKFWVTGYSRGAACANMVGGRLTDEAATTFNTTRDNVYVYTFATPQGVSKDVHPDYATSYTNIHNILNPQDPVIMLAPSALNFTRYGTDHYISDYVSNSNPDHAAINQDYMDRKPDVLRRLNLIDPGLKMDCENFMVKDFTIMGEKGMMYTTDRGGKPESTDRDNYKQGEFFKYMMDFLINDVTTSNWPGTNYTSTGRQRYYEYYQEPMMKLSEMFLRYDFNGIINLAKKVQENAGKNSFGLLKAGMSLMGCVINNQARSQSTYDNVGSFIASALEGAVSEDEVNYVKNNKKAVVDLFLDILITDQKKADFTISGSILGNPYAVLEGHGPEYLLAWLQNRDSYYTNPPAENDYDDGYKAITFSNIENTTINIYVGTDLNSSIVGDASGNYTINKPASDAAEFRFIKIASPVSYELQFDEPYNYTVEVLSTAVDGTVYNSIGYHDKFSQDEATTYRNDFKVNNVNLLDGEKINIDLTSNAIIDVTAVYDINAIPFRKKAYFKEKEIDNKKYGTAVDEFPYAVVPKITKSILLNASVKKSSDGSLLPAGGNFSDSYFITQEAVKEDIDLTSVVYKDIDLLKKEKAYVVVKNNVAAGYNGVKTYNDFSPETKTATEMEYNHTSIYEINPAVPSGVDHVLEVSTTTSTISDPGLLGETVSESTTEKEEPEEDTTTSTSESISESTAESITESETNTTSESVDESTTVAETTNENESTSESIEESSKEITIEESSSEETSETTEESSAEESTTESTIEETAETVETSETTEAHEDQEETTTKQIEEETVSGFTGTLTLPNSEKYTVAVPSGKATLSNNKVLYVDEGSNLKITITEIPEGKKLTKIKVKKESGAEQEISASYNVPVDYAMGNENIYVKPVFEDLKYTINFDGSSFAKIYDDTGTTQLPSTVELPLGTEVIIKAPWAGNDQKLFLGWTITDKTGKLINDKQFMSAIALNNSDGVSSIINIIVPNFDLKIKAVYVDATEEETKLFKRTVTYNNGEETMTKDYFATHVVGLTARATKSDADPTKPPIPLQSFKVTQVGMVYYLEPSADSYFMEGFEYKATTFEMPNDDLLIEAVYSFEPIPEPPTPPKPTPPSPSPSSSGSSSGGGSDATLPPAGFKKDENENHSWDGAGVVWRVKNKKDNTYVRNAWVNLFYDGVQKWYYFGDDTIMKIGWINYNNNIYYLQTTYNSTFGAMLTGVQVIDGVTYEFSSTGELIREIK